MRKLSKAERRFRGTSKPSREAAYEAKAAKAARRREDEDALVTPVDDPPAGLDKAHRAAWAELAADVTLARTYTAGNREAFRRLVETAVLMAELTKRAMTGARVPLYGPVGARLDRLFARFGLLPSLATRRAAAAARRDAIAVEVAEDEAEANGLKPLPAMKPRLVQ